MIDFQQWSVSGGEFDSSTFQFCWSAFSQSESFNCRAEGAGGAEKGHKHKLEFLTGTTLIMKNQTCRKLLPY